MEGENDCIFPYIPYFQIFNNSKDQINLKLSAILEQVQNQNSL